MEDFEGDCSLSLSSLICLEDESCFDDEEGSKKELSFSLNAPVPMENDDEYIKMLVSKEMNLEIKDNRCEQDCPNDRWLKCSRFSAVQWMLKVGFHQFLIFTLFWFFMIWGCSEIESSCVWVFLIFSSHFMFVFN